MNWDHEKERKAAKSMSIGVSVFAIVFAVFWCIMAASIGAWFMLLFGIPFVGLLVYRLVVMLRLTKDDAPKNSVPQPETDPWDITQKQDRLINNFKSLRSALQEEFQDEIRNTSRHAETPVTSSQTYREQSFEFCPYCGFRLQEGFEFCPKCGRRLN